MSVAQTLAGHFRAALAEKGWGPDRLKRGADGAVQPASDEIFEVDSIVAAGQAVTRTVRDLVKGR